MLNIFRENEANQIENFALKLSLEWGENYGKDIGSRLLNKFPELTENEIETFRKLVDEVKNACWNSVDYKGPQINSEQLEELLNKYVFEKYEWINNNNKSRILSQFKYYFWKDGLLQ